MAQNPRQVNATISLRFSEVEQLLQGLDKLDDDTKKTVAYVSLKKRLIGIRDFWLNEEKRRKARAAAGLLGKRRYGQTKQRQVRQTKKTT